MGKSKSAFLILLICMLIISLAGCSLLPHSTIAIPNTSTATYTTNVPLPSNSILNVYFIDVGQGDSILIDQGQTEVLIDGGSQSPGVTGFLRNYVDGDLEVMVATHPHAHIGGLIAVLDAFKVDQIWYNGDTSTSATYSTFMSKVKSEGAQEHIARLHNTIQTGALSFYVYNPATLGDDTNNNSIVLHLAYGTVDFLFMGDAQAEAEKSMVILSSVHVPPAEILKVGHHGSHTSSSLEFLEVVRPETAIYMAGIGNTYGHPHQETLDKLEITSGNESGNLFRLGHHNKHV